MLEAFEREGANQLLLLGDLLYHGPRNALPKDYDPKQVYEMLNARKEQIVAVRGNCDSEVDQMVLEFPMMADYCLIEVDQMRWYVTHGHLWNRQCPPLLRKGDVMLNGHFHVPACEHDGYHYLNPGSVSIPKEDSQHSYLVYENGCFEWKNLQGERYCAWNINTPC
jgi:putative phosphoesterase